MERRSRILVLGANGRVGRLLRAVWEADPPSGMSFTHVMRKDPGAGGTVVWQPGMPLDDLPAAGTVIALWGVVPAKGARFSDNAFLALKAVDIARAVGADRVFHCSSAAVYAPSMRPLSETSRLDPPSAYGAAKLEMERTLSRNDPGGPRSVCLRIGSVAGAESLFAAMNAADTVHLDRFADGMGPERSYIAPVDLARVLLALANLPVQDLPGVLNVGAPVATGMEAIARAAGRETIWRDAPETAVQRVVLDTALLSGFCPMGTDTARPEHLVSEWLRFRTRQ